MDETIFARFVARVIPLFLALPFAIVSLAVAFGPATVDAFRYEGIARTLPAVAPAIVAAGYAAFAFAFSRKRLVPFLASASASCAALAAASAFAGAAIHRDFLSAAFQYVFIFPVILVLHARFVHRASMGRHAAKRLANAGLIASAFYLEWIMVMGYAIATRAEPRPVESMLYNLYNFALTLVLLFASLSLKRTGSNAIHASPDRMTLDDKDITSLAGLKLTRLFYAFATAEDRRLRCPDIQRILYEKAEGARPDCARCDPESAKAAQCSRYRSTYNSILELKKLIEFLEIGTIVAGENRRHVLEDGWRLVLFEGARIKVER